MADTLDTSAFRRGLKIEIDGSRSRSSSSST